MKVRFCLPYFLWALFLMLSSCQDELSACFKSIGSPTEIAYDLQPFHSVEVKDGLHVRLLQGATYQVKVKAGENIIQDIRVENQQGNLILSDGTSCDWTRKYEPTEILVQSPHLDSIFQNGYGSIVSEDTLRYDSLLVKARYGEGSIELSVSNRYTSVVSHRNGTITIRGNTQQLYVGLLDKMPIFDGRDFRALYTDVIHQSNNSMHVYPVYALRGEITKKGNIYLYHQPDFTQVAIKGKGRVVDLTAATN